MKHLKEIFIILAVQIVLFGSFTCYQYVFHSSESPDPYTVINFDFTGSPEKYGVIEMPYASEIPSVDRSTKCPTQEMGPGVRFGITPNNKLYLNRDYFPDKGSLALLK